LRGRSGTTRRSVLAARDGVIVRAGLAEILLQEFERLRLQVGAGMDAEPLHLGFRRRPDAVELADRQYLDEGLAFLRRDDELAVGLAMVRGELGQELVVGDAGRGGEAGFL